MKSIGLSTSLANRMRRDHISAEWSLEEFAMTPTIVFVMSTVIVAETAGAPIDGPVCNPHRELCQIEHAAMPDEAPEHLPRGPAPPPQMLTIPSSTTATSGIATIFGPHW